LIKRFSIITIPETVAGALAAVETQVRLSFLGCGGLAHTLQQCSTHTQTLGWGCDAGLEASPPCRNIELTPSFILYTTDAAQGASWSDVVAKKSGDGEPGARSQNEKLDHYLI
jgi:hypothetical protein